MRWQVASHLYQFYSLALSSRRRRDDYCSGSHPAYTPLAIIETVYNFYIRIYTVK